MRSAGVVGRLVWPASASRRSRSWRGAGVAAGTPTRASYAPLGSRGCFTTMQGVGYSSPRGDANVFMLIFGWGMFIYAGMVALFFLGNALWGIDDGRAAPGVGSAAPETSAVGLVHPSAAEASDRAEHADTPASGECTRSGYGTELSPRRAEAGSPAATQARLDGAPYPGGAFAGTERLSGCGCAGRYGLWPIPRPVLDPRSGERTRQRVRHTRHAAPHRRGRSPWCTPIRLSPSGKLGGDVDRLHEFYRSLGFFDSTRRGEFNADSQRSPLGRLDAGYRPLRGGGILGRSSHKGRPPLAQVARVRRSARCMCSCVARGWQRVEKRPLVTTRTMSAP